MWLVGKGAEILKYIAEKDRPCTEYDLRKKKEWSSRTVWKQLRRLRGNKLVKRTKQGYEVTDWGFCALIPALKGSKWREILEIAVRKYPGGEADKIFGGMLRKRRKVDMEKIVEGFLKKPNVFLLCRTNTEGKITWAFPYWPAVDLETGRFNVRVLKKSHGKWQEIKLYLLEEEKKALRP